jgi:uncharacterized membrane protein
VTLERRLCGVLFCIAGTLHFLIPRTYEAIVPPQLPAHRELVLVSGAAEVAGGLAVLTPGLEKPARWWLLALLAAVYPANIHMALRPEQVNGLPRVPRWALWARLPVQGLFALLVVRATRPGA